MFFCVIIIVHDFFFDKVSFTMSKNTVGKQGELLAREFLQKAGYALLAANYSTRQGELDIVAQDGNDVVFIEVKARRSRRFGTAAEAVTWRKRQHIMATALFFLQKERPRCKSYRFDVIEVYLSESGGLNEINHIKEAFSYD